MSAEVFYSHKKRPLFSSHMIDLSSEPLHSNIDTCKKYFRIMKSMNMLIEVELGMTGGEEDGIDNTDIEKNRLYTSPQDVYYAYRSLKELSNNFIIAATFGNVHGVYKPGNVKLTPSILEDCQKYIIDMEPQKANPVKFVFHGGSGSDNSEIKKAIGYGVVKINIDTDLQWAFWEGVKNYYSSNKDYMQSQIGNPNDNDAPNKKYYDPRVWLREGELNMIKKLKNYYSILHL